MHRQLPVDLRRRRIEFRSQVQVVCCAFVAVMEAMYSDTAIHVRLPVLHGKLDVDVASHAFEGAFFVEVRCAKPRPRPLSSFLLTLSLC